MSDEYECEVWLNPDAVPALIFPPYDKFRWEVRRVLSTRTAYVNGGYAATRWGARHEAMKAVARLRRQAELRELATSDEAKEVWRA